MSDPSLWPLFVEVNVAQRVPVRERTLFVTIEDTGGMNWVDYSGRMSHAGCSWIVYKDGEPRHIRGDQLLSEKQVESEKAEFSICVELAEMEFRPLYDLIVKVGKPWPGGWDAKNNKELHTFLETIYWAQVNRFVFQPFNKSGDS